MGSPREKLTITVTVTATVGAWDSHEEQKVVTIDVADTTAKQATEWFLAVARDGWRSWFDLYGRALRLNRAPEGQPIRLRAPVDTEADGG